MRNTPLISVIVPTYNRAHSLPSVLDSIYAQEGAGSSFNMEVLVVDDGSTDATPDVRSAYPGIHYIRLPVNRGVSAARNAGILASRGRYIAFLDDDDIWLPHKVLRQVEGLEAHPDAAAVYSPYVIRFPGQPDEPSAGDGAPSGMIFRALLLQGNYCGAPISVLARRDAFHAAGGFDEGLPTGEDYDMWLRLAVRFPMIFVPGVVAVRNRALQGKYGRHLLAGDPGTCTRYVVERAIVERALTLFPDPDDAGALRREALATLEARIPAALCDYRQFNLMRAHLLSAIRRSPWIVHYGLARHSIAQSWGRFAMTMDAPIPATGVFCDELRREARWHGVTHWAQTRRLLGGVWMELGRRLVASGQHKSAGRAAALALVENPLLLGRKTLPQLITQAGAGVWRQTWTKPLTN